MSIGKFFIKLIVSLIVVALVVLVFWLIYRAWPEAGSISGTVLLGPACPVMRDPPDENCADKPYATTLVATSDENSGFIAVTSEDKSRVMAKFQSGADGKFHINIRPGRYMIYSATAANVLPYCESSGVIEVYAGTSTEVTVHCDTGIR